MAEPTTEQLVLYIVLPVTSFFVVVLAICCCYRERKLCFRKDRGDTLLAPEQKNRFRIKLGKKHRSSFADGQLGIRNNGSGDRNGKTAVLSPVISQPSYTESAPVGQVTSRKSPLSSSPPSAQLARQSHLLLQDELSHQQTEICEVDGATSQTGSRSQTPVLSHQQFSSPSELNANAATIIPIHGSAQEVKTSSDPLHPVPGSRSFDSRALSLSSPRFHRTPLSLPDLKINERQGYQSIPSPRSLQPVAEEKPMFAFGAETPGSRRSSYDGRFQDSCRNSGDMGTQARESVSSTGSLNVAPGGQNLNRRRSSMQIPIDLRQIDPKLYKLQMINTPSVDSTEAEADTPMIHFDVSYNGDLEVLNVKLIQARNLATQDFSGTSDPYCTVALVPGFNPRRSKVHKKTSNPEFGESFVFSVSSDNLEDKVLQVKTYDFDQFSRDECTGVMELNLKEIDFVMTPNIDLWRKMKFPDDHEVSKTSETFGDLMLALSYLRSAEKLTVAVQKARNLKEPESRKGLPDPYVKVALYKGKQRIKKKKTDTIHSTCNPVFNQALTFSVPFDTLQAADTKLICHVVHDFKLGYNEDLGQVEIGPNCMDSEERRHWSEMMAQHINRPIARWHHLKQPSPPTQRLSTDENLPSSSGRRKSFAVPEALQLHGLADVSRRSFS
nr:synaptotagmin-9-like [Ciona intestinalis]|eukprot:XP_002126514.3 synaptotagmin-9-like [Ciona intestinalis]